MDPFVRRFERLCQRQPTAPALLADGRETTRADLLGLAREAARRLAAAGVERGSVVALEAVAGAGFVAAWLALRMLDACAMLVDPGLPAEERDRIQAHLPAAFAWRCRDAFPRDDLPPIVPLSDAGCAPLAGVATIKLTSGSGGRPSGVAVSAAQLETDGLQLRASMGFDGTDRFLCVTPFSHSYGFSLQPTSLLMFGSALVLPGESDPFESARRFDASVLPSVPAWFRAQLRARSDGFLWPPSLRLYVSAGSPLPAEVARQWHRESGRPIQVLYGSSECGGIAFDRTGSAGEEGRVGTPVEGVKIELVPLESGLDGSEPRRFVRVHSRAVAMGYVPADAQRAARIAPETFDTEDLADFVGDELRLLGRVSAWINVNGKKVDPLEVESTIARMPGVDEVVVLGKPLAESHGEALRAVVASGTRTLNYREVNAWCRAHLASHKVPRSIVLVEALPRTERGKVDRDALLSL